MVIVCVAHFTLRVQDLSGVSVIFGEPSTAGHASTAPLPNVAVWVKATVGDLHLLYNTVYMFLS